VTKTGVPIGDKDSSQEKNGKSETAGESDNESLLKKSSRIPVVCWIPPHLRPFLETSHKEVVLYDVENSNDTVSNETYDSTDTESYETTSIGSSQFDISGLNQTLEVMVDLRAI